ncbi:MAG TPA: lipocalin family protein [Puia sp.]
MTYAIQRLRLLTRKIFSVIVCMAIGMVAFTTCNAQSIVGKWKGVSVKNYYSPDYAKQIGKSEEEKLAKDAGNSEMDFNADHSFKIIFYETSSSEATIMKGTWTATGDQLTLTLDPQFNPQKKSTVGTYTIHGETLVTAAVFTPPARIIKTVSTATRM